MEAVAKDTLESRGIFRELIRYSVPLIIANVLQSLYGLTDFFLAGIFLGDEALSAITNGGQFMTLYTGIIIGLSNGGNVMIGQYTGGGLEKARRDCTGSFLTLFFLIGAGSALVLGVNHNLFMGLLRAPALELSGEYLLYCAPGALAIAGYNAATATLRAVGDSRRPMLFVIISVTANVFLDVLLMHNLQLGVKGAAIATAISQYLSFAMAGSYLLFAKGHGLKLSRASLRPDKKHIRDILHIGIPCAIQMTVASVSWLSVLFLLNRYGIFVSTAYGASAKVKDLVQTVTAALSMAATAMISQALGSKQYSRALAIMYSAMKLALGVSAVLIIAVEILAPQLIGLFSQGEEVIQAGVENLRIEIIGQLFYASFMIYHSMMTGAGHTKMVLFSSFVNCILVRAVLAVILSSIPGLGATGVYLACLIAPASSIPIGAAYIRRGRWRKSLVS